MPEVKKHKTCLISGSTDLRALKGYEKHHLVKSYPVGFVFCSVIPTEEELMINYARYSRAEYLSPITVSRYNKLLDQFEKYRKTNQLLDIGCGTGNFLQLARERGWQVHGTEYTDQAIKVCKDKGIQMHQGKLDPAWFLAGSFDIITSFEVIEHINNPLSEVQNIRTLLREKGLFYFTTPNFNALERFLLKDNYNIIAYPEHLSYYTPKTIHYLLKKNQFEKKKLVSTGISLTRIKTSLQAANNAKVTEQYISSVSTDELLRKKIDSNLVMNFLKNAMNLFLTFLGIGNSIKGWYIKK